MNALVTIDTLTPEVVFAPGGVEAIISKLETEVRAVKTDMSSDEGGRRPAGGRGQACCDPDRQAPDPRNHHRILRQP
jgi:hypothetical protein